MPRGATRRKFLPWALLALILGLGAGAWLARIPGERPATLGVHAGRFAPCPERPNCVSSQSAEARHAVSPIAFDGPKAQAMARLKAAIQSLERASIVTADGDYLQVEFRSATLGFIDDVEFQFDEANRLIHVKSASRVGYSDFGVNRKRVEAIRARFAAQPAAG